MTAPFSIDTRPAPANLAAMEDTMMNELAERLERMVQIVMSSFPDDWPLEDKRQLALKQLGMLEDVA